MSDSDAVTGVPSRKRSHSPETTDPSEPADSSDVALFMPIMAKRSRLRAGSAYFGAMLQSQVFTEHDQAEITMQPPPGLDPNACNHLLLYVSGYFPELDIPDGQAEQILQVADYFQLPNVQEIGEQCAEKLVAETDEINCLRHLRVALRFGHEWLKRCAMRLVIYDFQQISTTADFLDCSTEQLLYILQQNFLVVPDEEQVVEAVMAWFGHDKPSRWRLEVFSQILAEIRWSLLSDGARMMLMSAEDPFRAALTDILQYSGLSPATPTPAITRPIARRRNVQDVTFTYAPFISAFSLRCMTTDLTEWPLAPYDPQKVGGPLVPGLWAVKVNGKIILQILQYGRIATLSYDPLKHTFETLNGHERLNLGFTMDKETVSIQPVVIRNKIYIFREGKRSQDFYEYNFKSKALHRKPTPTSGRRINCGIDVYRDEIILVGGQLLPLKPRLLSSNVDRFNPVTAEWTALPPLPEPTAQCAAKAFQDQLYVTGGTVLFGRRLLDVAGCLRLNLRQPTVWARVGSLTRTRRQHAMMVTGGGLYVVGGIGHRYDTAFGRYEKYVERIDRWHSVYRWDEQRTYPIGGGISVIDAASTYYKVESDGEDDAA
ncbi:kelch-like protein diablo [Paramacrobiotus metropolitanus]|uniref:kelch-like protein diablo n=1 Tax=Paramacrobiotus metropolitanus TaxID=2943436 RepID=UPI0024456106|nr:kelch-like protein diablo [Paramacrobiotus metropolitanus]XP_055340890.1 kelch-like protein diablo [Paramacrobiotus metropolitanus]